MADAASVKQSIGDAVFGRLKQLEYSAGGGSIAADYLSTAGNYSGNVAAARAAKQKTDNRGSRDI
jgi:hypothetical protein